MKFLSWLNSSDDVIESSDSTGSGSPRSCCPSKPWFCLAWRDFLVFHCHSSLMASPRWTFWKSIPIQQLGLLGLVGLVGLVVWVKGEKCPWCRSPGNMQGRRMHCAILCQGVHFSVLAVRFLATSGTSKLARLPDFSLFFLLHHRQLHPAANSEVVGLTSNWSAGGACGVGCVLHGLLCHPWFADSDSTSSSRSACTGPIGS